jgi:TatD DNase family protein
MIDSHCHLNYKSLKDNFDNIILRAKDNNLTSLLSINTNPLEFEEHLSLINKFDNIYMSYGLHPEEVTNTSLFPLSKLEEISTNPKIIGIGETGLDFYHSEKYKFEQYKIFETHIHASISTSLPLIIHQRNSENEIIEILEKYKKNNLSLVFHCFTGTKKLLNFCLDNNYYISISGIVTFKNANLLREVIKNASLDHILIETDSPFLAPSPMRGKINEPSFIKYTAQYLADFFSIQYDEFIELTDNNFYNLFSKAKRYNNL